MKLSELRNEDLLILFLYLQSQIKGDGMAQERLFDRIDLVNIEISNRREQLGEIDFNS